jgi:hypothetical protein
MITYRKVHVAWEFNIRPMDEFGARWTVSGRRTERDALSEPLLVA